MPAQYQINKTPTPIYPGGHQGDVIVYNPGNNTNPIYIDSSSAINSTSLPLQPGTSVEWSDGNALWAISPNGAQTLVIVEEASNLQSASDIATALIDSGLATDIADAIYLQGVPVVDNPQAIPNAFNPFTVTPYSSVEFDLTVTIQGGSASAQKDILYFEIQALIEGSWTVVDIITCHSDSTARVVMPTIGTQMQVTNGTIINTSGSTYGFNAAANLSYRTQQPSVTVRNTYWDLNLEPVFHRFVGYGGATGQFANLTNSSVTTFPSYRRGAQSIGILLSVSVGSSGSTMEMAVKDTVSGFWLCGIVSETDTAALMNEFSCNLLQQPELFLKTTSTVGLNFTYTQFPPQ